MLREIDDQGPGGALDRLAHARDSTALNENLHRAEGRVGETVPDVSSDEHHGVGRRRGDGLAMGLTGHGDERREDDHERYE